MGEGEDRGHYFLTGSKLPLQEKNGFSLMASLVVKGNAHNGMIKDMTMRELNSSTFLYRRSFVLPGARRGWQIRGTEVREERKKCQLAEGQGVELFKTGAANIRFWVTCFRAAPISTIKSLWTFLLPWAVPEVSGGEDMVFIHFGWLRA